MCSPNLPRRLAPFPLSLCALPLFVLPAAVRAQTRVAEPDLRTVIRRMGEYVARCGEKTA